MLSFRMANASTASRSSASYQTVPERSTSAIASGLTRLFGPSPSGMTISREASQSSISGQVREECMSERRPTDRDYDAVRVELSEYLEEPLETFLATKMVRGRRETVIFDVLAGLSGVKR